MIGVDLGKRSFQLHGVREDGSTVFRKKVSRERFLAEVSGRGPAHRGHGGLRQRPSLGPGAAVDGVRGSPGSADASEAVRKGAQERRGGRGGGVRGVVASGDAVRGGGERGAAGGRNAVPAPGSSDAAADPDGECAPLAAEIDDPEARLPETVRGPGRLLLGQIGSLDAKIGDLDKEVRKRAKESDEAKRLTGIPGIGPICAMATQAFAPPMEGFRCGCDVSAWLGLVPRQCSTGGGATSGCC